jgi:hypothetical protein
MEKVTLSQNEIQNFYSGIAYLLKYFNYSTRGFSVGEDHLHAIQTSYERTEKEVSELVAFLGTEFSSLDPEQFILIIHILDELKGNPSEKWFFELLTGFLEKDLRGIDPEDQNLLEKRFGCMDYLQGANRSLFSTEQILAEIGIKRIRYWDWIDLLSHTDITKEDFFQQVIERILFERKASPDVMIRIGCWRQEFGDQPILDFIDTISQKADFDIQPLIRWKSKRF